MTRYSYPLGLYLGDGWISDIHRGVYSLSIALDLRYPNVVDECHGAMVAMRREAGRACFVHRPGCVEVLSYWKHWPCLFPQHGPGPKHKRPIILRSWQKEIAAAHPERLLRGLIHSDGCRRINRITARGKIYEYPRYFFSNASDDIRRIFCAACDGFGVRWTRTNRCTVAVSRAPDVARLDGVVGPKT